jgi:hypothetical protein
MIRRIAHLITISFHDRSIALKSLMISWSGVCLCLRRRFRSRSFALSRILARSARLASLRLSPLSPLATSSSHLLKEHWPSSFPTPTAIVQTFLVLSHEFLFCWCFNFHSFVYLAHVFDFL